MSDGILYIGKLSNRKPGSFKTLQVAFSAWNPVDHDVRTGPCRRDFKMLFTNMALGFDTHSIDPHAAAHAALSIVHSQVKQTTIVASSHVCSLSSPQ